jgi:hypothetical protein
MTVTIKSDRQYLLGYNGGQYNRALPTFLSSGMKGSASARYLLDLRLDPEDRDSVLLKLL